MKNLDEMTFAQFATRFARIERLVPEPPPLSVDFVARRRRDVRALARAAAIVGAVILLAAALGLAAIGSQPSPPAVTTPPDSAPPAVVLDAYLQALQAGDCATASHLVDPVLFHPGKDDLCGMTRVTTVVVLSGPITVSPNSVGFTTRLTITGTDRLPGGEVTWFYVLRQQSGGAWRIEEGVSGSFWPLNLPSPPPT